MKLLPLEKLVEVVSQGVGRLTKAHFFKKDAEAKAYEMKVLAAAKVEEAKIMAKGLLEAGLENAELSVQDGQLQISNISLDAVQVPSIEVRAENRISHIENKRQTNIEAITAFAADSLRGEETVSEERVDEDWINRFFRYAEDISNEEMQALWGKVLAGEVKKPSSFPLRTLDILRNLSQKEAEILSSIADKVFSDGNGTFIFKNVISEYTDVLSLYEANILQMHDRGQVSFGCDKEGAILFFLSGKMIFGKSNTGLYSIVGDVYTFTKSAIPILSLIDSAPKIEYLKGFSEYLKKQRKDLEVVLVPEYKLRDGRLFFDTGKAQQL